MHYIGIDNFKVNRSKLKKLLNIAALHHWDLVIISKKSKHTSIKRKRYNKNEAYISHGPFSRKHRLSILYTPFSCVSKRKLKKPPFRYFLIPVIFSLVIACVIDRIIIKYYITNRELGNTVAVKT